METLSQGLNRRIINEEELAEVCEALQKRSYQPQELLIHYERKGNGKVLAFGLPSSRDKIVLDALFRLLSPFINQRLLPVSLASHPGYSRHTVLKLFQEARRKKSHWVLTTDVGRFFYEIDHQVLDSILKSSPFRLSRDIRELIHKFLSSNERRKGIFPSHGISRLLSNCYLHPLDVWAVKNKKYLYNHYCDDIVVFSKREREAFSVLSEIKEFLAKNLKLEIAEHKTYIKHRFQEGFEFLGFKIFGDYLLPTEKVIKSFKHRIKVLTGPYQKKGPIKVIRALNKRIHNFGHMYKMGSVTGLYEELDAFIRMRLRSYLKSRAVPCSQNPCGIFVRPENFPANLAYSNKEILKLGLASLRLINLKCSLKVG